MHSGCITKAIKSSLISTHGRKSRQQLLPLFPRIDPYDFGRFLAPERLVLALSVGENT